MTNFMQRFEMYIGQLLTKMGLGMKAKLIILFVIIKVIPLVLLTLIAWSQFQSLAGELNTLTADLKNRTNEALTKMGRVAVEDSVDALNDLAIIQLERTSTDLANRIAAFLYARDSDIRYAVTLEPGEAAYRNFLRFKTSRIVKPGKWILAPDGKSWIPETQPQFDGYSASSNVENNTNYRNRQRELWDAEDRPLYLEMTYVDLAGNELIKVTTSDQMDKQRKNIASRLNTYVKAETYFAELKNLKPGDIYVSDVIGAYTRSHLIGMYTPENAAARGQEFRPEEEAYAGRENPNGRRFKGIIRWAMPVVRDGQITGYVTLALDHDHIMEFTDHITPMNERYVEIPSAYEGNYAFIWDYQCRNIVHPRHHSIVGYNPDTGESEVPWLEDRIYNEWQASGRPYAEFIKNVPVFQEQSRRKKPAPELTAEGLVGLDGRYLNNAPQCIGWMDLTKEGGSGSFLILWSGIWKPNTAATIPYYTGNYGKTKRGFGFVAIGAGLEDFQRPARETEKVLGDIIYNTDQEVDNVAVYAGGMISSALISTAVKLGISAVIMIALVVLIAIWVASFFSNSITYLISGISRFRAGERHFRFNAPVKDEIGTLADCFDEMADSLVEVDRGPLVITDMDMRVMYVNDDAIVSIGKGPGDILGRPYFDVSLYPENSAYDPIAALHEFRETEILYKSELRGYFKGEASYMTDKFGKKIGYIITSTDVTEIMEQQKALEAAMQEAKLANEHKGNFLARMSHEIRTPMNAIIGMTGIVKKKLSTGDFNLDELKTNISQIETSSQHLLGLLNDILDISKIEAGKIEISTEEVELMKLAHTVAAIIKPRCEEKNISFETRFDIPAGKLYQGDALRLRQVLINLLGNAVKFTGECGTVAFHIALRESVEGKSRIDFSVRDSGIGIAESALDNLFKPFQQADNQISKKYGGTGLGLAISRSIVQLMGGDIAVKSVPDEGSEFSFTLVMTECGVQKGEDPHIENTEGRLKGKRALLVDDVAINRMIAASMLEGTGLEIDEADDGEAAFKAFAASSENTYDIIYMDVQMPVMNGYDAARAIRGLDRPDAKTVPIVALTANAFKEDVDQAIASGMNAHLAKPMDPDKVLEITFKLLEA
jgi:signal transduction histidine kinase/HAMP domain-containing protein/ActR/RegA family two-component response regulator